MKFKNSLLIVYKEKDKEYFKHLKSLIDSKDDTSEAIVGTEDGTVRVMKCVEQKWLQWEKRDKGDSAKNLAGKILFIGDIKDIKVNFPDFNQYGIKYGCVDESSFAIQVDENHEWKPEEYAAFLKELKELTGKEVAKKNAYEQLKDAKDDTKKAAFATAAALALFPPAAFYIGGLAADAVQDMISNKKLIREQMLYFGITKAYLESLDDFMKTEVM